MISKRNRAKIKGSSTILLISLILARLALRRAGGALAWSPQNQAGRYQPLFPERAPEGIGT